jgi:hypothetical protein
MRSTLILSLLTCSLQAQVLLTRIPLVNVDVQWAILKLQLCDALHEQIPNAASRLALDPPMFFNARLAPNICGQYNHTAKIAAIAYPFPPGCYMRRETIAHELLHFLGIMHPSNPKLLTTKHDPVHRMLQRCLGSDYHKPTKEAK